MSLLPLLMHSSDHSAFINVCHWLTYHIEIPTKCITLHNMCKIWPSYRVLEGMEMELQNHCIVLTRCLGVSTFVSVTLLDNFKEASQQFEAVFLSTKKLHFWWETGTCQAVFDVTACFFSFTRSTSRLLQPCLWQPKRVFLAKTWSFSNICPVYVTFLQTNVS